jgi:hypothetical protein
MIYNIYVQDQFAIKIEATNTGEALKMVGIKIDTGEIQYDPLKPKSIKVEPEHE